MSKFRKKPVVIEARRFEVWRGPEAALELAAWCGGRIPSMCALRPVIEIDTLEGAITASDGDWIIRGVQGEFYPCKPDIFAATYEAVEG
jgi:hypothetical protein